MISRRSIVAAALAIAAGAVIPAGPAHAQTAIKFTLDWKFEGPAAPFLLAIDKGYFKAEGLDVTIDTGAGSRESIPRGDRRVPDGLWRHQCARQVHGRRSGAKGARGYDRL
jgi:hypothetical protein